MSNPITFDQEFVYIIHAVGTNRIKIGFSINPQKRLSELQIGSPFRLEMLGYWPGGKRCEKLLHRHFKNFRKTGEWFEVPPFCGLKIYEIISQGEAVKKVKGRIILGKRGNTPMAKFKRAFPKLKPLSYWDIRITDNRYEVHFRWKSESGKYKSIRLKPVKIADAKKLMAASLPERKKIVFDRVTSQMAEKGRQDLMQWFA